MQCEKKYRVLPLSGSGQVQEKSQMTSIVTHRARITGPIPYVTGRGRQQNIPVGPCLVESLGERAIDIIWGTRGQSCAALPIEAMEAAKNQGHLVLLD
jgi:hypothetical protein